jgi:lysophospholipid acyltransferase (LPLAT)-like uncharacterized protein
MGASEVISTNPVRQKRRSSRGVVNPPAWYQRVAAWVVWALVRCISATLRYRIQDNAGLKVGVLEGPAIYAVWHNRLAVCLNGYTGYVRKNNPTPGMAAVCSASKDGALVAAILDCFGVRPVRGSSSRRGGLALLELTSWAERGFDLAITPDGPRGPRYIVQEGLPALGQLSGLPIIPAAYNLKWKIGLKSWDRFQIPLPFSVCMLVLDKPIHVPREISDEEREEMRQHIEARLRAINVD